MASRKKAKPESLSVEPADEVKFLIPASVMADIKNQCKLQGIDIDTFLRLSVRKGLKIDIFWIELDYKGEQIAYVIKFDPEYITWCLETLGNFHLGAKAQKALDKVAATKKEA